MHGRSKSYWVLITFGGLLLVIQLIATMGAHDMSTRHFQHKDAVCRLLGEIHLTQMRAMEHFSPNASTSKSGEMWHHLAVAEAQLSIVLNGEAESAHRTGPISDGEGRQISKEIKSEMDSLRVWLHARAKQTDPSYVWEDAGDEAFSTSTAATYRLLSHLQVKVNSDQALHERLEIAALLMIAAVIVSGVIIVRRNDKTHTHLLKLIASDEKDLRTTLDSITDGVMAIDPQGCITRMNAVAERLTGRSVKKAQGLKIQTVFKLDDDRAQERLASNVKLVLKTDMTASTPQSGRLVSLDGDIHAIECRISEIRDEGNSPMGAVLVFRQLDEELELRRQLKEQETRHKAIVDCAPIGMYVYEMMSDESLVMRSANPAASELVGADQSSNIGKTIEEAFPPLVKTDIPDAYRKVASTGETWHTDQIVYEDENISGAFDVRAFQIAPNWMVAAFANITKRKQAEHELSRSEAKFRYLFETMEQGVVYQKPDGAFVYANPAAMRILGLEANKLYAKSSHSPEWKAIDESGEPLPRDSHPAMLAIKTRRPVKDFLMGVMNQSERAYRWLRITAIPEFRPGEDEPYQVYTMFRDVTARQHADAELKKLRNILASTINSMPSVLIGIDPDCKVTHWNERAESVTEVNVLDALGRQPDELYPAFGEYVEKAKFAMEHQEIVEESHSFPQATGNVRYEDVTIYPLISATVNGAVIRVDDITEQRQLVEQLRQSQKMDAIGQLAGGVAHDFNNMLGGILGAAELLQDGLKGEKMRFAELIIESAERAAELTQKLLTFSRKGNVESSPVDVHHAIESAVGLLERTLDKRVVIETDFNAAGCVVDGDEGQLQNAIINMGINAGHAMPNGGVLTFTTQITKLDEYYCNASPFDLEAGDYLELDVRDSGCGMPLSVSERIFEPFFTTRGVGQGTGLGLSAVYGTIQQHHGAITVRSEPDKGTVFQIHLPLSEEENDPKPDETAAIKGESTILVVDDESIIRTTAQAILKEMGFSVLLAENGKMALEIYERDTASIDLVLLDMIMPEMDGKDTFVALKKLNPNVKVIVSSGFSRDGDLTGMTQDGLLAFIRKPYRATELGQAVSRALAAE